MEATLREHDILIKESQKQHADTSRRLQLIEVQLSVTNERLEELGRQFSKRWDKIDGRLDKIDVKLKNSTSNYPWSRIHAFPSPVSTEHDSEPQTVLALYNLYESGCSEDIYNLLRRYGVLDRLLGFVDDFKPDDHQEPTTESSDSDTESTASSTSSSKATTSRQLLMDWLSSIDSRNIAMSMLSEELGINWVDCKVSVEIYKEKDGHKLFQKLQSRKRKAGGSMKQTPEKRMKHGTVSPSSTKNSSSRIIPQRGPERAESVTNPPQDPTSPSSSQRRFYQALYRPTTSVLMEESPPISGPSEQVIWDPTQPTVLELAKMRQERQRAEQNKETDPRTDRSYPSTTRLSTDDGEEGHS